RVEPADEDVLAELRPRVDVVHEVVHHRMRPTDRFRPAHDVDLVTADADGDVDADHCADARTPEARGIDDARRADLTARRGAAGAGVPVGKHAARLRLLEEARAAIAGGTCKPLGCLGGIAVAGIGLVAASDQILDMEPRLDVVHLVRRYEPCLDAYRALKRHR